ncbi:MAG TPA: transglutaminase domain-containing protein, partial [Phycisphaerales bacterium]|nr:transglutaminase domain-containing protein [Phycisphaerales bacterium]
RASDGMIKLAPGPGGRIAYTVTSAADFRELDAGDAQPPPNEFAPRVKALAESILADRDVDAAKFRTSPTEVRRAAQAFVTYLSAYPYTLEMIAPKPGQDPIEMFLFDVKRGHCEYFSAAMTAMLRSVGIHARIATGFAAAEFNSVSGYYTVRQSDAHAWVEVRMSPDHWETFDPTPPGELQSSRRASAGPIGWLKHLWDAIEFSWLDNVVAYDKGIKLDVVGLAGRADPGAAAVRWQNRLAEIQNWFRRHLPEGVLTRSLIVGVATFALVMGFYWFIRLGGKAFAPLRMWFARLFPGAARAGATAVPVPPDALFYREALVALAAAGRGKPDPSPPLAFAQTLEPPAAEPLRRIAELYYRSRFGASPLEANEQAAGRSSLADLRAALQSHNRPRT